MALLNSSSLLLLPFLLQLLALHVSTAVNSSHGHINPTDVPNPAVLVHA